MAERPFNRIEDLHYCDADTGAIIETVKMRRFYDWDNSDAHKKPEFRMVRQYALDRERLVNPNFRG